MRSNYGRRDIACAEGKNNVGNTESKKEEEVVVMHDGRRCGKGLRSHRELPSLFEYFLAAKFDCSPALALVAQAPSRRVLFRPFNLRYVFLPVHNLHSFLLALQ
jgi:hypothetical protein